MGLNKSIIGEDAGGAFEEASSAVQNFKDKSGAIVCILTLMFSALAGERAYAQQSARSDAIYIIYDSSSSMWGELKDRTRKYETGRKAVRKFLKGDFSGRTLALRTYGHRRPRDCRDSQLTVPFQPAASAKAAIADAIDSVRPTGKTPIDYSLRQALKDFGDRRGSILLISDGLETCAADPCALMAQWRDRGIDIRVNVVGVGIKKLERSKLACIAENSGGRYFDANSADELRDVLEEARDVAVAPKPVPPAKPKKSKHVRRIGLIVKAHDDQGRKYYVLGKLFKDGREIGEIGSRGRYRPGGLGDYTIEVGPVLNDGSIYRPVTKSVKITKTGTTKITVLVERPAIVRAKFTEEGKPHRGSHVYAYQDGRRVFGFRRFDEALARPGTYEFRSAPNQDNQLSVKANLTAGVETIVKFDLTRTVRTKVAFRLPNGDIIRRNSYLWRDGRKLYGLHPNNFKPVRPGTYQLRSPHGGSPLTPVDITIPEEDGQTIEVPLDVGYLVVNYPKSDNYKRNRIPVKALITALDRTGGPGIGITKPIPLTPGRYKIKGWSAAGYFDPIIATVNSAKTTKVVLQPKPLGTVIVTYAPSDNYKTKPNRAFLKPLGGKRSRRLFAGAGRRIKVLTGRYKVTGWTNAGDFQDQTITVKEGQTVRVVLQPK